jgi:uncharacterized membrane protein YraQ (UPF0718 family)
MNTIVQWATILSPIIAVVIAYWMSKSSKEDTAKQVAALEESTTKQVESIKALSKQMVEASIKQVELEIEKNLLLAKQAKKEWEGIKDIKENGFPIEEWRNKVIQDFRDNKPERDYNLYCKFIKQLEVIKKDLEANKMKLN